VVAAIACATRSGTTAKLLRGRWRQSSSNRLGAAVVEPGDALVVLVVEQVDQEHAHSDDRQEH
jgi:hypothetical protein